MKNTQKILLIVVLIISVNAFSQGKPEKFSNEFLSCFLNYNDACAEKFISTDSVVRKEVLKRLNQLNSNAFRNDLKGKALSSSTRAVLKAGDEKHKQIADIFIEIVIDKTTKYELSIWGCCVENGKWILGNKLEMERLLIVK